MTKFINSTGLPNGIKLLTITCYLLLISACASQTLASLDSIKLESAKAATHAKFTPEQAISDAQKKLNEAYKHELAFFSPLHLKQAGQSITEAKAYLTKPPKDIKNAALMSAIAAQKFVSDAYNNKDAVKSALNKSLLHLQVLKDLNAQNILEIEYNTVYEQLLDLIKEIESGELSSVVHHQSDLLDDMAQVEIATLKKTYLQLSDTFMAKAKKIDADNYAKKSYTLAETAIDSANDYISKNYRNRKGVKKITDTALLAAKKSYFIALESEKIVQLSDNEAEKHTLHYFSLLDRIYDKAYGKKLEPQDFNSAVDNLVHMVERMKQKIKDSERALTNFRETAQKLKEDKKDNTYSKDGLPADEKLEIQDLPLQEKSNYNNSLPLQEDEQGFDSIEKMGL